jgi:ABC-2 type transport system permease protein
VSGTLTRVAAIARRDARIELSYHFVLLLRGFSIAFTVVMFAFISQLVGDAPQLEGLRGGYLEFVVIGLVLNGLAITCATAFNASISRAQTDDTLEVLLATPTPFGTLLGGTLAVPLGIGVVEAAMAFGIAVLLGATFAPSGLALGILVLLPLLGTFAALGIVSAAVIVLTKRGDPFSNLTIQASNLLAGAMFPVALLPDALQHLARLVPAFYGLRSLRAVLLADAGFADVLPDVLILVAFNIVLLPLALAAFRWSVAQARVTGTLGNR